MNIYNDFAFVMNVFIPSSPSDLSPRIKPAYLLVPVMEIQDPFPSLPSLPLRGVAITVPLQPILTSLLNPFLLAHTGDGFIAKLTTWTNGPRLKNPCYQLQATTSTNTMDDGRVKHACMLACMSFLPSMRGR